MNSDELNKRLKQLKIEDFIWIIYIGIIILSWYSNSLERKYFLYNDKNSKKKYREILILIFSILVVIYLYFLKDSIDDIKNLKPNDPDKKKLIAISGFIFLFIAFTDNSLDIELAFN